MEEAESFPLRTTERLKMRAWVFEQMIGSDNIGRDKFRGPIDRPIDMGFGGKVYDSDRTMLGQQFGNDPDVANIALNEDMMRISYDAREVVTISCISEFIQNDDGPEPERKPVENKIGADETSATRDEHGPLTRHPLRSTGGFNCAHVRFS